MPVALFWQKVPEHLCCHHQALKQLFFLRQSDDSTHYCLQTPTRTNQALPNTPHRTNPTAHLQFIMMPCCFLTGGYTSLHSQQFTDYLHCFFQSKMILLSCLVSASCSAYVMSCVSIVHCGTCHTQ